MTNFERWKLYTSGLSSPESYIDWSWYYTISAALQRRVYLCPMEQPVFSNMYVIFVGEPGIGKGLPIREVSLLLKHWLKKDAISLDQAKLSTEEQLAVQTMKEVDDDKAQQAELQVRAKGGDVIPPLLIPVAADATTYEALVKAIADSFRRIQYIKDDGKLGTYGHSSLCFCLQELSSLLRKRTEDTVNFMLGLYDCPVDYEYITKTQGKDRVRRGCLNLLAGTTPSFMRSTFDDRLMGEGFSSRTFYIFAQKNRKNQFFIPPRTEEQEECRKHILEHIRKLTTLYGQVKISDETFKWLEEWWDRMESNRSLRPNKSTKLIPYYARKNIHVMKLAMALHFSDSLEMMIPLETFQKAIKILDAEERNMHFAITVDESNPLAKMGKAVLKYLETGEKNFVDMYAELWELGGKQQLEETLEYLVDTQQVNTRVLVNEKTEKSTMLWSKRNGEH